MPPGSEPWSGSVSPKQPISSPLAIPGKYLFFCSSVPKACIGYIVREPCTETQLLIAESPLSNSWQITPYATFDRPAHS